MAALRALAGTLREIVTEQVEFRELLFRMTARDLTLRYKESVMGFGWAIFMPLLNTAVFSVIFTQVAPIAPGMPYPLFAYSGLTAWNFTASALRFSATSLTANPNLVSKVRFPREVFPLSSVLVSLVDAMVASIVLVALMAFYHVVPGRTLLLLPVILAVQTIFTLALALLLSMGNLFFRDVKYLTEVVVTVWMFATSVVYPLDRLSGKLAALAALNPMTHIIDAYRDVLLRGTLPDPFALTLTAGLSLLLLLASWIWFHSAEFTFAENI